MAMTVSSGFSVFVFFAAMGLPKIGSSTNIAPVQWHPLTPASPRPPSAGFPARVAPCRIGGKPLGMVLLRATMLEPTADRTRAGGGVGLRFRSCQFLQGHCKQLNLSELVASAEAPFPAESMKAVLPAMAGRAERSNKPIRPLMRVE